MADINLRIRRSLSVIAHSDDVVELRSGVWNKRSYTLTDDKASGKLLTLVRGLDGTVSPRELAKREGVARAEVESLIDHLTSLGVLERSPRSALDAYLDTVGGLRMSGPQRPIPRDVLVVGDPEITAAIAGHLTGATGGDVRAGADDDPALWALRTTGSEVLGDALGFEELTELFEAWRDRFVIVAESVVNPVRDQLLNRLSLRLGFPWMHAALDGPFALVGPTFLPGRSACYECFEARTTMNLRESRNYLMYKDALAAGRVSQGVPAVYPPVKALLAGHVALEATNLLATGSTFTVEQVLGIYLPTMEIAYNEVLRLPGCPGCGSLAGRDDSTLHFDPRAWLDA